MFRPVVDIIRSLSIDALKIILCNSRGGVLVEEISISEPLLEE